MEESYEMSQEAQLELHKAKCYFQFIGKEEYFLDDFVHQVKMIQQMPKGFQIRYRTVRVVTLEQFNYSIHYTLTKNEIYILRILHQNQNY